MHSAAQRATAWTGAAAFCPPVAAVKGERGAERGDGGE